MTRSSNRFGGRLSQRDMRRNSEFRQRRLRVIRASQIKPSLLRQDLANVFSNQFNVVQNFAAGVRDLDLEFHLSRE